jgi:hypothetical protein
MTHKIADGYNNIAGLTALDPQGRTDGVMPGRFTQGGDGHIYEDGFPTLDLEYGALTETQLDSLLTQMGLTGTTRSNEVTIEAPRNHDRQVSNWNAIVSYPQLTRDGRFDRFFWRNIKFHFYRLVALDERAYY